MNGTARYCTSATQCAGAMLDFVVASVELMQYYIRNAPFEWECAARWRLTLANGPGNPATTIAVAPGSPVLDSDNRLNDLLGYYHTVHDLIRSYATKADRIDNTILVLSVLVSGAFWLLASQAVPQAIAWAGATVSTVVTGLTIYLYASGLNRRRKKAHELYTDIGQFIAKYRADHGMSDKEYWDKVKRIESEIEGLKFGRE